MNILLVIDDSPHAGEVIEAMAERSALPDIAVRVLSVVAPFSEMSLKAGDDYEHTRKQMRKQAEQMTASAADALQAKGLTAELRVREGEPVSEIVAEAKEWPADLIVIGSHAYAGSKPQSSDSVAQSVVNQAPCAVGVIPQPSAESRHSATPGS